MTENITHQSKKEFLKNNKKQYLQEIQSVKEGYINEINECRNPILTLYLWIKMRVQIAKISIDSYLF